jgi:hypothetical protein
MCALCDTALARYPPRHNCHVLYIPETLIQRHPSKALKPYEVHQQSTCCDTFQHLGKVYTPKPHMHHHVRCAQRHPSSFKLSSLSASTTRKPWHASDASYTASCLHQPKEVASGQACMPCSTACGTIIRPLLLAPALSATQQCARNTATKRASTSRTKRQL